jgi:hypothetical protein
VTDIELLAQLWLIMMTPWIFILVLAFFWWGLERFLLDILVMLKFNPEK